MATTLPESSLNLRESDTPEPAPLPDASHLQDKMPEWFRSRPISLVYAGFVGLVLVWFSNPLITRIWHTDVWGHLAYGRLISQTGQLPVTEPLLPLAEGVKFVDTAWLSQVIAYQAYQLAGVVSLQFIHSVSIAFCVMLLIWRLRSRTGSDWLPLVGAALFLVINHDSLLIVRPQLAGIACFGLLFFWLTGARWRNHLWISVPLLFILWANLHGSFLMGLYLLRATFFGRAIDVLIRTRNVRMVFAETNVRRYFLLTELAAAAALANPYGLGIYSEALAIAKNVNLMSLTEWQPLTLKMVQGPPVAVCALLLILCYRLSPRRVTAVEVLQVFGLGLLMLWTSRMIIWWAPVAAYYLCLHTHAVLRDFRRRRGQAIVVKPARSLWTVGAIGVLFILVQLTPYWKWARSGGRMEVDFEKQVSPLTPVRAVNYLHKNPPQGLVFNTYEWGDYLVWAGPENIQVYSDSHAHLLPSIVWDHYFIMTGAQIRWDDYLDMYGVNAIVISVTEQEEMMNRLKADTEVWRLAYEDGIAVVFYRRQPIL